MTHTRFLFALLFLQMSAHTQTVDTAQVYSRSMHRKLPCVIYTPASHGDSITHFPVVYLLHGFSGKYSDWPRKEPKLMDYASHFGCIIVCPDGGYASWYVNSPVDPASQMKTFITTELPAYVDAHYPTIAIRERRAITGLSMGGHGAILAALERPTVFGAAASMSGAMELREIKGKYDAIKEVGDTMLYASTWEENSVTYILQHRKISPMPDLMFDCGINDQFFNSNKRLHVMLSERKIPHTYIERPGGHSWEYWLNALPWHLQFFASYFARPVTQHTQIK